jgi:hypothetical protein
MSRQSRRSLLTRGLVLVGGAVGVGAGTAAARPAQEAAGPKPLPETLTLAGRNWSLSTPERKPGERIRPGDHGTVTGELIDPSSKQHRGSFYASRLAFHSGLGRTPEADAAVELHTFKLDDGTIMGMGSAFPGETVYAIVGGTGRYAGARGTYAAQQHLRELGGNGTAHFVLNLSA